MLNCAQTRINEGRQLEPWTLMCPWLQWKRRLSDFSLKVCGLGCNVGFFHASFIWELAHTWPREMKMTWGSLLSSLTCCVTQYLVYLWEHSFLRYHECCTGTKNAWGGEGKAWPNWALCMHSTCSMWEHWKNKIWHMSWSWLKASFTYVLSQRFPCLAISQLPLSISQIIGKPWAVEIICVNQASLAINRFHLHLVLIQHTLPKSTNSSLGRLGREDKDLNEYRGSSILSSFQLYIEIYLIIFMGLGNHKIK